MSLCPAVPAPLWPLTRGRQESCGGRGPGEMTSLPGCWGQSGRYFQEVVEKAMGTAETVCRQKELCFQRFCLLLPVLEFLNQALFWWLLEVGCAD